MTNAILRGKPDAGNPHVRFDEGEVASAKPRRGSLLYMREPIKSVLSLAFAFGLAAFAQTASAAPTAKAVWDANTNTFTFYYDENTYEGDGITQYALPTENKWNTEPAWNVADGPKGSVTKAVFDESFADYKPANMNSWFGGFSKLTSIEGMEYLDTSNAGYCSSMFSGCSSLTSIDLSHFNTTKMQFREFFKNCSSIEELDLTSFTTVVDTRSMFYGMSKLKRIYVTESFSWSGSTDNKTFSGCSALVGGAGTSYAEKKVQTQEYARIDNPPDAPGYFTLGQKPVPPEIDSVTASEVTWESATVTVDGSTLNDGSIIVELITGGETAKSAELTEFGAVAFTGLTPATEYAVKVTATSKYGTTVDEATSFTTQPLPVPTISGVKVDTVLHDTVMLTVSGESIADVEVKVDLVEGGEIRATKTEDAFGEFVFEGLTPETTYTVKVTATNQYGPSVDESTSFTTLEKPADEWKVVWDETGKAGMVSWSKWKFNVTLAKDGTLAVGLVTAWPDSVYPLDFSLPVKDENGADYVISSLDTRFGFFDTNNKYTPTAYPQAAMVGLLTLPGEGLVKILGCAFMGCTAATGHLEFPSTLTDIGDGAFWHCTTLEIDFGTIPVGVRAIPQYCFSEDAFAYGDAVLPNVKSVGQAAFRGTGITSISFGSELTDISGNNDRGAFYVCTSLTNVMFAATAKVRLASAQTFYGCTELEVLDLSPVVDMTLVSDRNDYSHINGCSKLKKIIFGAGLTNLTYNAMAGASALEEVVFEGVPPIGFKLPYLSADNSRGHVIGYDSKSITTYVHRKLVNEKNEAGMCWADYAANGVIGPAKKNPAKNTTWAAEYVYEGVDLANRQLLTMEPNGFLLLVR